MTKRIIFILGVILLPLFLILKPTHAQVKNARISGTIFIDENQNGVQDKNEKGHINGQIGIQRADNKGTLQHLRTNIYGQYTYTVPISGLYTVGILLPKSSRLTTPQNFKTFYVTENSNVVVNLGMKAMQSTNSLTQDCISYCSDVYGATCTDDVSKPSGQYCQCPNGTDAETNNPPGCAGGGGGGATGCAAWGNINNCSGWCQQNGGGYCIPDDNCATCHGGTASCTTNDCDTTGAACGANANGNGDFCVANDSRNYYKCCKDPNNGCQYSTVIAGACQADETCQGNQCVQQILTISGFVFYDFNRNATIDSGEFAYPQSNITITINGPAGLQTASTDSGGAYSFNTSSTGFYTVCLTQDQVPAGYERTSLSCLTASLFGGSNATVDFGIVPIFKVTGNVFIDANKNGLKDNGESGKSNETIEFGGNGTNVSPVTTDSNGNFTQTLPFRGDYTAFLRVPNGFQITTPPNPRGFGVGQFSGNQVQTTATVNFGIAPNATPTHAPSPTPTRAPTPTQKPTATPTRGGGGNPTATPTNRPIATATPTQGGGGANPTATPMPTNPPQSKLCNQACSGADICQGGLACIGACRNPQCPQEADCNCFGNLSPTPPPTAIPTPTGGGGANPTPTPAGAVVAVEVTVALPGIGIKPGDNPNPIRKQRTVHVYAYRPQMQELKPHLSHGIGTVRYDPVTFSYKGIVLMQEVDNPSIIKIRLENTLQTPLPDTFVLRNGTKLPLIELISGDINDDGKIDLLDYNALRGCFNGRICSKKLLVDFNDDGLVEERDVNILLRGIALQPTDENLKSVK